MDSLRYALHPTRVCWLLTFFAAFALRLRCLRLFGFTRVRRCLTFYRFVLRFTVLLNLILRFAFSVTVVAVAAVVVADLRWLYARLRHVRLFRLHTLLPLVTHFTFLRSNVRAFGLLFVGSIEFAFGYALCCHFTRLRLRAFYVYVRATFVAVHVVRLRCCVYRSFHVALRCGCILRHCYVVAAR